jgi:heat shock protein HspQ
MIKIGDIVKCIVTGFEGIVIGYAKYAHNCDTLQVKPNQLDSDGKPKDAIWFDLPQLEKIGESDIKIVTPHTVKFKFGDKVKDKYSSYNGFVTSFFTYLNGCVRIGVQSSALHEGKPIDELWMPYTQLELVEETVKVVSSPPTGGPIKTPSFQKTPK